MSCIVIYNFLLILLFEKNLKEEKVYGNIYVMGNIVIDVFYMVVEKLKNDVIFVVK